MTEIVQKWRIAGLETAMLVLALQLLGGQSGNWTLLNYNLPENSRPGPSHEAAPFIAVCPNWIETRFPALIHRFLPPA